MIEYYCSLCKNDSVIFIFRYYNFLILADMSNKFTYEGYTLTTQFTNDFTCSMGVSDNITGEFYMNNKVQLTKIKKDTILATLNNKNPKCLKCTIKLIQVSLPQSMLSLKK